MNRPTCETCPFWNENGAPHLKLGRCQRNPPAVAWVPTKAGDWCGSHPQFADFKFQWRQAEIKSLDEKENAGRCPAQRFVNDKPVARCVHQKDHEGVHVYHETNSEKSS